MSDRAGFELCESPLERRLADAFAGLSRWAPRQPDDDRHEIGSWPGWAMVLLAQVRIGDYRPDFVITTTRGLESPGAWVVIIEVDGHDFHERTKEQARRDRSRDRFFTERDCRVLRFTGSEVHRDAVACAVQAWRVASALQSAIFDREFEAHLRAKAASLGTGHGAEGDAR